MRFRTARRFMWSIPLAVVLALLLSTTSTNTASVNFQNDVNAAIDAGIPVVTMDAPSFSSKQLSYIGTSNEAAGYLCGKRLIEQIGGSGSVLVTTNLEFARWNELFGDERMTAALLDRLTFRGHVLVVTGESFRLKESLRRHAAGELPTTRA